MVKAVFRQGNKRTGRKRNQKNSCFSPAFVADCLETIYEIGTEYKEIFMHAGGEKFDWAESLNSNDKWVEAVGKIILK